jgi:hypothetical protein
MLAPNNPHCSSTTAKVCVFIALRLLSTASIGSAEQATSQVATFTGTIPGQPDGPVALRLRLFSPSAGGSQLFEETQTVMVVSQSFTVRIGDATAGGVPATLFRDNLSLWIAFALDATSDMEIGFRTAFTSGGYAHAAQLLSSPMLRTVNGMVGDVALAAGTNVTITPSGNTLTIHAWPSRLPTSRAGKSESATAAPYLRYLLHVHFSCGARTARRGRCRVRPVLRVSERGFRPPRFRWRKHQRRSISGRVPRTRSSSKRLRSSGNGSRSLH